MNPPGHGPSRHFDTHWAVLSSELIPRETRNFIHRMFCFLFDLLLLGEQSSIHLLLCTFLILPSGGRKEEVGALGNACSGFNSLPRPDVIWRCALFGEVALWALFPGVASLLSKCAVCWNGGGGEPRHYSFLRNLISLCCLLQRGFFLGSQCG